MSMNLKAKYNKNKIKSMLPENCQPKKLKLNSLKMCWLLRQLNENKKILKNCTKISNH